MKAQLQRSLPSKNLNHDLQLLLLLIYLFNDTCKTVKRSVDHLNRLPYEIGYGDLLVTGGQFIHLAQDPVDLCGTQRRGQLLTFGSEKTDNIGNVPEYMWNLSGENSLHKDIARKIIPLLADLLSVPGSGIPFRWV